MYTPSEYQSSLKSNEIYSPRIECEKNLANTIFFPCSWLTLQPPMAIKRSVHSRQLFTFELQWKIIQLYTAPNLNVIYFACSARIYCVSVYWLCALVFKLWLVFFFFTCLLFSAPFESSRIFAQYPVEESEAELRRCRQCYVCTLYVVTSRLPRTL